MTDPILRDGESARELLFQSLWLQRALYPKAESIPHILNWAAEILHAGDPLPPLGFVADLGHLTLGLHWEDKEGKPPLETAHVSTTLLTQYEDHVLGTLDADWSFSHACDAVRQYESDRDKAKGIAHILKRFRARADFLGVEISAGVIHGAREMSAEDILRLGYETLERDGPHEYLEMLYRSLIDGSRRVAEVLSQDDVQELRLKTPLDPPGEQLAMRQSLHAASDLNALLPRHKLRPLPGSQVVPTRVLDEDTYPVGGYTSISNRGSVESMLHSQLAYIEDEGERPDLFEIRFARDELFFYSRDENQFLRRRRRFVLAFLPDLLEHIRFKDPALPYQRSVMLVGAVMALVPKLIDWLSTDALRFDLVFFPPKNKKDRLGLKEERDLFARRFHEWIEDDTVRLMELRNLTELGEHCSHLARNSLTHCLVLSGKERELRPDGTTVHQLLVREAAPVLVDHYRREVVSDQEEAMGRWGKVLEELLQRWI